MVIVKDDERVNGSSEYAVPHRRGLHDDLMWPEGRTDVANARRLVRNHGDKLRFCHQWQKWIVWDGDRWKIDDDGAADRLAKSVSDEIWRVAQEFGDADIRKHASRTAGCRGVQHMLEMAESEPGIPVHHSELDRDGWLLNCLNGTVDLRTGTLRPHSRDDYITKLCPVTFNADSAAPTWERFLSDVFQPSPDVIPFLQRFLGYCAAGVIRDHILPVFWGGGSNGKTTLLNAVSSTLGADYAVAAAKDLLLARKGDSHPTELADLHGKRLVVCQETEDGRRFNESLVKQLTGGDTVKARRMREDFWQFSPTHKLILSTNHKPRVNGTDEGIWRRLRLVPFAVRFEGNRVDRKMPERLRDESQGILAWIVAGAVQFHHDGLCEPQTVRVATRQYRDDSDLIGRFLSDRCVVQEGARVKSKALVDALAAWCAECGETAPSSKAFGQSIRDRGFRDSRSNGIVYHGIGLIDDRDWNDGTKER